MNRKWIIVPLTAAALLILTACQLLRSTPVDVATVASGENQETFIALSVQQTLAAALPDVPDVPQPTFTASLSPAPQVPMVTVSVDTNCRTGPGSVYDILGYLLVGQTAEVVGRSASSDNWIIKLPSNPAVTCWLWGYYATVVGDTTGLPVYTPPPTPTPAIAYNVVYLSITNCPPDYAFRFNITNTGSLTWESIQIVVIDNTTATTFTHTLDAFRSYNGCGLEMNNDNLEPGETGVAANINPGQFTYNPSGHSFTAIFRLCSGNGMGGTCVEQTLNFNP